MRGEELSTFYARHFSFNSELDSSAASLERGESYESLNLKSSREPRSILSPYIPRRLYFNHFNQRVSERGVEYQ